MGVHGGIDVAGAGGGGGAGAGAVVGVGVVEGVFGGVEEHV